MENVRLSLCLLCVFLKPTCKDGQDARAALILSHVTVSRLILHAQSNPLTAFTWALSLRSPCCQVFL